MQDKLEKIIIWDDEYEKRFGELPMLPFMVAKSRNDERYEAMIKWCVQNNKKADDTIITKFFNLDENAIY